MDSDLAGRLDGLKGRVREAVDGFRATDANPDDPYRGLYVSDDKADALLAGPARGPARMAGSSSLEVPAADTVLGLLVERFGLIPIDLDLLVAAVGPDLDSRFELLYGYLHDDLTRRRCSIGLALDLAGRSTLSAGARARFAAGAPLVRSGLLVVEEPERPFLTRPLRAPDRVVAHLLGDDSPDGSLLDLLVAPSPSWGDGATRVARAAATGTSLYIRQRVDAGASGVAAAGLVASGRRAALVIDLSRIHPDEVRRAAADAVRECRLTDAGLVCLAADDLHPSLIRQLTGSGIPLVLIGRKAWDPDWSDRPIYPFELEPPDQSEQGGLWAETFGELGIGPLPHPATFRLGPERIRRAAVTAMAVAADRDEIPDRTHLVAGARAQNATGLASLARRVEPSVGWGDIVLDPSTRDQLLHLTARVEHRAKVLDDWGLRRGGGRGEGVIGLFAGDSGTGKTLAAEIIAGELDLDLYVIDLSTVIDKYIGETEKNLDRIFDEAEGVNGILFFDEADALFGKRTDVSDARDRYANVEVAYLLQRLESFDGLGILATNLRNNIDDAFARRLGVVVDFPEPDESARRALWHHLSKASPHASDVDLDYLAKAFELTGGNIRNVVVSAAYLAAAAGDTVTMKELIQATQIEYRKLGRLCNEAEFGPYSTYLGNDGDS